MGFLLIYDVGNVETFHSVRDWLSEYIFLAYSVAYNVRRLLYPLVFPCGLI